MKTIVVEALVSSRTGAPLVNVRCPELELQLSIEEVRELAMNLLQAAEAAYQDSAVIALLGLPEGAQLIAALRELRNDLATSTDAIQ